MGLSKLGQFIEQSELRNTDNSLDESAVVGLSTQKQIIITKADLTGVGLTSYKLLPPCHFAYVPDTSRRGDKMSLGYNTTNFTYLVSPISVVFKVTKTEYLLPEYLYMYYNRPEFDRYARFNSWGSAREAFSWDDMCDVTIDLPPMCIQRKYVDIYKAMLQNQQVYERGLDDLKLVCDAYVEKLRHEVTRVLIGDLIVQSDERNTIGLDEDAVRGISTSKNLIPTKADLNGIDLSNYKTVRPNAIAYVPDTSRRGDKISIGYNNTAKIFLVSSISLVFNTKLDNLLPAYLMLFFCRKEFDRYTRFHSWGSAREAFSWENMCNVTIPLPEIGIQQAIVNIYNAYEVRCEINDKLVAQIKDLCPILIKGSIEEGKNA